MKKFNLFLCVLCIFTILPLQNLSTQKAYGLAPGQATVFSDGQEMYTEKNGLEPITFSEKFEPIIFSEKFGFEFLSESAYSGNLDNPNENTSEALGEIGLPINDGMELIILFTFIYLLILFRRKWKCNI